MESVIHLFIFFMILPVVAATRGGAIEVLRLGFLGLILSNHDPHLD